MEVETDAQEHKFDKFGPIDEFSKTTNLQVEFQKFILPEAAPAYQATIAAHAAELDSLAGYAAAPVELTDDKHHAVTHLGTATRDGPVVKLELLVYTDQDEFARDAEMQAKILHAIVDHFQVHKKEVKMKAIGGSEPQSSPKAAAALALW